MNMRKITSMTMVWSLVILTLNSLVLYVVPEGRISYWADWRFLGLTKSDWSAQHITVGVLFLVAGILHIYLNWQPILSYMKDKARKFNVFSGPSNIGLALSIIFVVGTYFNVPPMSTIVEFSEHFKDKAEVTYGNPPYGQAQSSSLKMFTERLNLDLEQSIQLLGAAGVLAPQETETIRDIAKRSGNSPKQIYKIIKPAAYLTPNPDEVKENSLTISSGMGKSGMGRRTVAQVCEEIGKDCAYIIKELNARGIKVDTDKKLKDLASENNTGPMQIYEAVLEISSQVHKQ